MEFTNAQKEEYLSQYDKLFHTVVYRFMIRKGKYNLGDSIFDDLYQECRLAFLEFLDRCETDDDLKIIPFKIMNRKMNEFYNSTCVVNIPDQGIYRNKVSEIIKNTVYKDKYDDSFIENVLFSQNYHLDCFDEVEFYMDFKRFLLDISPIARKYVYEFMEGYSEQEVADRHGVSLQSVNK